MYFYKLRKDSLYELEQTVTQAALLSEASVDDLVKYQAKHCQLMRANMINFKFQVE